MKSILIPTDFSPNAESALNYAVSLFSQEPCTFYLLNSYFFSSSESRTFITTNFIDKMREGSLQDLNELKRKIEKSNTKTNHNYEVISSGDELPMAITKTIKNKNIDLVIMGTKGASGINKFFFGSNTVKTIENIKAAPVLAVPGNVAFTSPKQIAFPTDFNRSFDMESLAPLLEFASANNAHVNVLHINVTETLTDTQNMNMITLKEHLLEHEHSFHWMPNYTKKSEVINDFIEELHIDVLAMFNYKHSIIENIVKEPIIKNIGYQPTIPFLIIPSA